MKPPAKALYYGDNLDWLRKFGGETVDLVYLDPPSTLVPTTTLFSANTKRELNALKRPAPGPLPKSRLLLIPGTGDPTTNKTS